MKAIILPPDSSDSPQTPRQRRPSRLYTLLGGNGSGKSLFMQETARLNAEDAYAVSAVTGGMPGRVTGSLTQLMTVLSLDEEKARFRVLKEIWEETFPGNKIDIANGKPKIHNRSGKDSIGIRSLSRGEKAALYYIASIILAPQQALI